MARIPETESQFVEKLAERVRRLGDPQEFVDILVEFLRMIGWGMDMTESVKFVYWIADDLGASCPEDKWHESDWPYEFKNDCDHPI